MAPQAQRWLASLGPKDMNRMAAALARLKHDGPGLGRPFADSIKGSRFRNMKELRSVGGHLRALFAFGPDRRGIVLLGGDKTNDWRGWYERSIPQADKLYEQHLRSIGKDASCTTRPQRAGTRSAGHSR